MNVWSWCIRCGCPYPFPVAFGNRRTAGTSLSQPLEASVCLPPLTNPSSSADSRPSAVRNHTEVCYEQPGPHDPLEYKLDHLHSIPRSSCPQSTSHRPEKLSTSVCMAFRKTPSNLKIFHQDELHRHTQRTPSADDWFSIRVQEGPKWTHFSPKTKLSVPASTVEHLPTWQ